MNMLKTKPVYKRNGVYRKYIIQQNFTIFNRFKLSCLQLSIDGFCSILLSVIHANPETFYICVANLFNDKTIL